MAPKRQAANGFMVFTFEWKAKKEKSGQKLSISAATTEAGKLWAQMSPQQRGPYNEKAKKSKYDTSKTQEKLTCTGIPVSVMEKEQESATQFDRRMKMEIESTVEESLRQDELDSKTYYFIMVNYFVRIVQSGEYIPAEISLAAFSLKEGVKRKYHSFVNPSVSLFGHQYEAQQQSNNTHKLGVPPNAKGSSDMFSIYKDIMSFIYDKETDSYPPLYTERDCMPIVVSVLDFLKSSQDTYQSDIKIVQLNVYSIQLLFFHMKTATCQLGEVERPKNIYITDAFFDRDSFEYEANISCTYHEDIDRTKYCTQSYVTRWGFMFADYMCGDIAILLVPGRHCPVQTKLNAVVYHANNTYTESVISINSAKGVKQVGKNDDSSSDANANPFFIGRRGRHTNGQRSVPQMITVPTHLDDSDLDGPWTLTRNRNIPPVPHASHFEMSQTTNDDDSRSFASIASGRSMMNPGLNISSQRSVGGRGRMFH